MSASEQARGGPTIEVVAKDLHQKHPITPYAGKTLHGKVEATYLRGELIYVAGDVVGGPTGRCLKRESMV